MAQPMSEKVTFWTLLRESTIVSGLIALSTVGALVYLSVIGQAIPDALQMVVIAVVSFFFGTKVGHGDVQLEKHVEKMGNHPR
jgi:hypothetical protein